MPQHQTKVVKHSFPHLKMEPLAGAVGTMEEPPLTELPLSGTQEAAARVLSAAPLIESASEATRLAAVQYGGTNTDSPVSQHGQSTSVGYVSGFPVHHDGGWSGLRGPHLSDVEAAAAVVLSGQLRSQPVHVAGNSTHAGLPRAGAGSGVLSVAAAAAGGTRSGMSWSEAAEGVAAASSRDGGPQMSSHELSRLGPGMASAAGSGPAAEIALTHAAVPDAPAPPAPAHAVADGGGSIGAAGLGTMRGVHVVGMPSDAASRDSAHVQVGGHAHAVASGFLIYTSASASYMQAVRFLLLWYSSV